MAGGAAGRPSAGQVIRGFRAQRAGVQGVAVAGQAVAAVVVEQGRDEVHLDVGPVVASRPRDQEAAGLGDVGGAFALVVQEVAQADAQFAELVVGDRLRAAGQRADVEVILQVAPDLGQFGRTVMPARSSIGPGRCPTASAAAAS
jgi:hypothetical protein